MPGVAGNRRRRHIRRGYRRLRFGQTAPFSTRRRPTTPLDIWIEYNTETPSRIRLLCAHSMETSYAYTPNRSDTRTRRASIWTYPFLFGGHIPRMCYTTHLVSDGMKLNSNITYIVTPNLHSNIQDDNPSGKYWDASAFGIPSGWALAQVN